MPDAGPADAGVVAGPCDPSIAAAEGVAIADTGACPGVLPAAVTCAAEITICSGLGSGDTGMYGNAAIRATSDGRGSAVLTCHRNDVGPSDLNFLFVPTRSGFVSKAGLGVDVRPLRDGFVASNGSYILPPPAYDFLAHDGDLRRGAAGLRPAPGTRVVLPDLGSRAGNGELNRDGLSRARRGDRVAQLEIEANRHRNPFGN